VGAWANRLSSSEGAKSEPEFSLAGAEISESVIWERKAAWGRQAEQRNRKIPTQNILYGMCNRVIKIFQLV